MPAMSADSALAVAPNAFGGIDRRATSSSTAPFTFAAQPLDADHPLSKVERIVREILNVSTYGHGLSLDQPRSGAPDPGRMARAVLLQILYAIGHDQRLLEQLRYDLRFRWFCELRPGEPVWTIDVHMRARLALLQSSRGWRLIGDLLRRVRPVALTWPDHFGFDETLVDHWRSESPSSLRPVSDTRQRDRLRAAGFPDPEHAVDGRLAQALELILMRLCEPGLNGDTVAAETGMSRRALYYLFEAHGLTPSVAIRNLRLHHCRQLLEDPRHRHRKLSALALDCGFGNIHSFSRTFKQRYGVGPRACRAGPRLAGAADIRTSG